MSTIVFRAKKMTKPPNAYAQSADMGVRVSRALECEECGCYFCSTACARKYYNVTERSTSEASGVSFEPLPNLTDRNANGNSATRLLPGVDREAVKPTDCAASTSKTGMCASGFPERTLLNRMSRQKTKTMISPATSRASMRTRTCWSSRC